jgi:hypothetical protein
LYRESASKDSNGDENNDDKALKRNDSKDSEKVSDDEEEEDFEELEEKQLGPAEPLEDDNIMQDLYKVIELDKKDEIRQIEEDHLQQLMRKCSVAPDFIPTELERKGQ